MKTPAPTLETELLLRRQYRWMRLGWPLGILCFGLAATLAANWFFHPSLAKVEQWHRLPLLWISGLGATFAAAFAVWFFLRRSLAHTAQRLDASLDAKNRLETAAALRDDLSPIARVQREETAGFLSHAPVRNHQWPFFFLLGGILVLVLAHFVTLVSWTRPWVRPVVAAPKPLPPAALPKASITWKTPEAETKASPIEEVPLQAIANSSTGLRDLVLHLEVNGEPRLKVPIPIGALAEKGRHTIEPSIYLDQLEVQPFDIVSYHLRAQRIDPRDLPATASPVQFVQVKPFREDVAEVPGGESRPERELIKALKVAQLRLIKENFILSHTDLAHDNPDWLQENGRVGNDQTLLESKTGEVIEKLISKGCPAEIVHLVTQSRPFMSDAAQKIVAAANQPALSPQGKALGLITQVEKFFINVIAQGGSSRPGPKNPEDPFKKIQELELKQRLEGKAGELELLAREQARLSGDLAQTDSAPEPTPTPADAKKDLNRIDGNFPERQTQISQRVAALINGKIFLPEIVKHLTQGREEAIKSLRLLDAIDIPGAREPAGAAARELSLALELMNQRGEEEAKMELAAAASQLEEAADDARKAPEKKSEQEAREQAAKAAEQAAKTADALAKAAHKQQESGSAEAAQKMMELAKAVAAQDVQKALEDLKKQPHDAALAKNAADQLNELADRAGREGTRGPLSPEQIAKLIEQLERTQTNMERLAKNEIGEPKSPSGESKSPSGEGKSPSGEGKSPSGEGKSPSGESKSPSGESKSPSGESKSPSGESKSPSGESKSPSGEGKSPSREGKSPSGEGKSPSGEGKSPSDEGKSPSGEGKSPSGEGKSPSGEGQAPSGAGSGTTTGSGSGSGSLLTGTSAAHREEFSQQLLRELLQQSRAAENVVPQASAVSNALQIVAREGSSAFTRFAKTYPMIQTPLQGTIDLLRAQLDAMRRQYQLTANDPAKAPVAYRPAVADYFERLSEDYQATANPSPTPKDEE